MNVNSPVEAQKPQRLDTPANVDVRPRSQASGTTGVDDLAALFSQEVELNSMGLGRRQLGTRVTPVEQLTQLYEQLGHPAQATLATIARNVRVQLLLKPSVDKLLDLTGNDPARTFVVLKQVAAQAQAQARTNEAALANDALARLEIRFKPQIQAGLNIALALQASMDDPHLRQAVRSVYYASVVARQSLASMMNALLGLFGGNEFGHGLKLMRRALADDIAAHSPSLPTAQLRTLLMGLRSCGQLGSVLSSCQGLIARMAAVHPGIDRDAVALLQRLLGYVSTGIAPAEIQRLASELGGAALSDQLVSLNSLYPVFGSLPLALWRDSKGRQEALLGFMVVMDEYALSERGFRHVGAWPSNHP
ncbi:type III secretion system gatekeeper subunit SctW [Pseudomonas sp. TH32]|uniref:type III secretion system gatekeeper subunit SctW n=1 Tax=unclassified Pseudomonas TaxID=196821 RepID=UPI001914D238|nr:MULTISPECIES: type III secretion system gatekeeper subunit SctW [unclassified Pseudomonas]MBK5435849.1 type III secretion system gatekeeper subunit SctW [Pseudomonas sp. TH32]MDF3201348.1 type III secretion system gatekeeper subunit SctW [Pseudomonas sp. 1912-s]